MTIVIVFIVGYVALMMLAMSMARHQEQVAGGGHGAPPRMLHGLRLAGWALLTLALVPALAAWGSSVGVIGWLGVLTFSALAAGLQLTYAPSSAAWTVPSAIVLVLLALAAAALMH